MKDYYYAYLICYHITAVIHMQMLTFVFQVHTRKGAVINDGHDSQEQDK